MENLSKEEVVKIIQQKFKDRLEVRKPTEWYCVLSHGYITLCTALAIPKDSRCIMSFDAEYDYEQPDIKCIKQQVENNWMYLSLINRSNYENILKIIQKEDSA